MTQLFRKSLSAWLILMLVFTAGCGGCGGKKDGKDNKDTSQDGGKTKDGKKARLSLGSAPVGGAFFPVGGAIADALTQNAGENNFEFTNQASKGSQANIRDLANGKVDLALANSAITYFAVNGQGTWEKKYDVRTVVTLAPNVAMFITKKNSGVKTLADMKGKSVMIGPSGAGFKMFVEPLLAGHGIAYDEFTLQNGPYSNVVDSLKDGRTDVAFVGGAVPMAVITNATTSLDVHFIPFDEAACKQLVADYPFFSHFPIPVGTYGLKSEFPSLDVGSMHLITSADMDEELVYQITKIIWENRGAIKGKHAAGKAINKKNAARFTGTPFHPGAIRFYKEIEIWEDPKPKNGTKDAAKKDAPKKDAAKKDAAKKDASK